VAGDADVPDAGDLLWIDFGRSVGHEQGGRRPAVVLTSQDYNRLSSVLVVCPITRKSRDWPFQVQLPADGPVKGAVLVDQIKVIDPMAQPTRRGGRLPDKVFDEVRATLATLLGIPVSN
jgi:mRNA interferase MazF